MRLQVKVKPNAARVQVVAAGENRYTVCVRSPPVDGKANAELVAVLAEHFGVSKRAVCIHRGHDSR